MDLDIVHVENHVNFVLVDDEDDIRHYELVFQRVQESALPKSDSLALVKEIAEGLQMSQHHDNAATWCRSTYSDVAECVVLTAFDDAIAIRDSKDPAGPVLHFTGGEMLAFLLGAKAGEFDDVFFALT